MAKETYKTWLPVFPGFYETGFMNDDQIDNEISMHLEGEADEHNLPLDFVKHLVYQYGLEPDIRYKDYEKALAQQCCEWVEDQLQQILDDKDIKVEFEEVSSPREYNFRNDSIDCTVTVDLDKVMNFVKESSEEFQKYLEEEYTSYDGFHSYYSSKIADWLDPEEWTLTHQVGAVLDFVIKEWFHRNHRYADESMLWYAEDFTPMEYIDGNAALPDILRSEFIRELAQEYMNEYEKTVEYLEGYYRTDCLNYAHRQKLEKLASEWLDWAFSGIKDKEALEEICDSGITFEEYLKRIV